MRRQTIHTIAPRKGDLVKGHTVYMIFPDLPAVSAKVVNVSDSGHSVTIRVSQWLAAMDVPRETEWTWRRSVNAYQQKGERTAKGCGLALKAAA